MSEYEWATPELTPDLWDESFKVALKYGLLEDWVFDPDYRDFPELPSGLVWVWFAGAPRPHWSIRGTGVAT